MVGKRLGAGKGFCGRRPVGCALLGALALLLAACDARDAERAQVLAWSEAGRLGGLRVEERAATAPAPGAETTLTVVATGDLKGWLTTATLYPERAPPTGLAYLAPVIAALRAADDALLLLDAGDALHGAPSATLFSEGSGLPPLELPIVPALNALRYDAMTLGNFDLALGWAALAHAEAQSDFPWLAANLERTDGGGGTRLRPYRVLERHGVRVGVLGLTTPLGTLGRDPRTFEGLRLADLEATARRWVSILRQVERVDVLIGLFHSGLDGDYARDAALRAGLPLGAAAGRVAEAVPGFDLIVAGDAHRLSPRGSTSAPTPWGPPVVEPGAYGRGLAVARLHLAERGGRWSVRRVERHTLAAAGAPDETILRHAAEPLRLTAERLAEPTAVRFRRVPRRDEFHRCAGALSHDAAAFLAGEAPAASVSLLPMGWDFDPPARHEQGRPLRRAHLYRWLRYGDPLVQAPLTGRQVELLLDGYVRHVRGWRVPPLTVLWPGGLRVELPREGSELARIHRADGRPLRFGDTVPVWLTAFVWHGGLGLAGEALLPGGPPLRAVPVTLRAGLFALLSDPAYAIPPECARWLEH
jgi:2',3'-cyclic-nucleotide 2'-phosphodiesterase (5'-nucleotidase family)